MKKSEREDLKRRRIVLPKREPLDMEALGVVIFLVAIVGIALLSYALPAR